MHQMKNLKIDLTCKVPLSMCIIYTPIWIVISNKSNSHANKYICDLDKSE